MSLSAAGVEESDTTHIFRNMFGSRLRIPVIAAPMLRVSGIELVSAACAAGVVGAFPTANARTVEELDNWLTIFDREQAESGGTIAPYCPNLIIRQPRLADDLACLLRHRVELVIASVGSPAPIIGPLHDIGAKVFADVGTLRHAEKAVAAGADGLVLLSAGAGGQTGWMNPFVFVRAVREFFEGTVILAGGISDGHALWAAEVAGYDAAYMGTRFIATDESAGAPAYKDMLVASTMDDVLLTNAFTGLRTNMLEPSIRAQGLDPGKLNEQISVKDSAELFGAKAPAAGPVRWTDVWSAGHTVSGVKRRGPVSDLVRDTRNEYDSARARTRSMLEMQANVTALEELQ
ncbi:NAD(P)H-dependent flavin oxidoreductase [Rhodococcus sp. OK302]|uniref:NAD(P)H-dependent flavin oxidoreductase n=1 Tax=Rhodococcus sp. OK302 TaxID=1882769 RepID=UPI000B9F6747|nr:nitronate monooxygenase [Rhodococcus sp. OK302]OYD68026.1 nitronate monooxygenase [Rhodococcus sp. OK302]